MAKKGGGGGVSCHLLLFATEEEKKVWENLAVGGWGCIYGTKGGEREEGYFFSVFRQVTFRHLLLRLIYQ